MYSLLLLGSASLVLSLLLTPLFRNLFARLGWVDRPDGARKLHTRPVPRLGGVPLALSIAAATGILMLSPLQGRGVVSGFLPLVFRLAPAALLIFCTGVADDLFGLRPWQKLAGQLAAAGVAWGCGLHISFRGVQPQGWWSAVVTVGWLVICTNAFNLIDGMDGLAAGVGLFASVTMLISALLSGNMPLAFATAPVAGALLGFLRYNFNPASIFLGDSGSLTIGFLLGCYGTLWAAKSATILGITAPLMALAVPLLDTALAILRRVVRGQPIFAADRRHIHHRLLDRGLTPRRVVLILYGVCGIAAALSLLQGVLHEHFAGLVIILFCLAAWVGIQHLGYLEFGVARRLLASGSFFRVLNGQIRLRALEEKLEKAATVDECWSAIRGASLDFGFSSISMCLDHTVFTESFNGYNGHNGKGRSWTVRVPLSDTEFVELGHPGGQDSAPMVVAPFADLLQRTLQPKLPAFQGTDSSVPSEARGQSSLSPGFVSVSEPRP